MQGLGNIVCALNKISSVDKAFFIVCAVIIALIVAVYFLIPVINKKFYKEQRDNLHKREAAFKSNINSKNNESDGTDDGQEAQAETPEVSADE